MSLVAKLADNLLRSIVIPPEVLVYDAKTNGRLSLGRASPVFGTSLSQVRWLVCMPGYLQCSAQFLRL